MTHIILNGNELVDFYNRTPSLKPYVGLLSQDYPLITDSNGKILSQPPLINSKHTQLKAEKTKDIFVELTGQCVQRLKTALTILCSNIPNSDVELVQLENCDYLDDQVLRDRVMNIDYSKLSSLVGCPKDVNYKQLLTRMLYGFDGDSSIIIPAYRSDVLHNCDVAEDLAIA